MVLVRVAGLGTGRVTAVLVPGGLAWESASQTLLESLILAQDERWRRA